MTKKLIRALIFVMPLLLVSSSTAFELNGQIKNGVREMFSQIALKPPVADFGKLPEGLEIIEGKGFRGIKIQQGKLEIRVHTWLDETGLLENYNRAKEEGSDVIAAVNGAFYSPRGVLGQVIADGRLPGGLRQIPGVLSRCFVASFRGAKKKQYWYLGETSLKSEELMVPSGKSKAWFNTPAIYDAVIDNLLGGGGWILRERKDVHMEAYDRQRFRFRSEDQTSRKTVVAQDCDRNLYFVVFDNGFNFHMVARTFVKEEVFAKVRDVMFLDGGSSSAMVLNGKYLVSPLYLVDKARFSCIQVLIPPTTW